MVPKSVKAVVFDLDNTLIDFLGMKEEAIDKAIDSMIDSGLKTSKEEAKRIVYEIYEKKGMEYQYVFQDMLEKIDGRVDYKILCAGVVEYRKIKESFVEPYPHVFPTLIELIKRGYKLAIVSDAPRIQAWTRLAGMRLQHFFDVVVAFEDTHQKKPEKLPFEKVMELLQMKPEEVLMVGDSVERDINGAKAIGMKTAIANYGAKEKSETNKADYVINDIFELLDILK